MEWKSAEEESFDTYRIPDEWLYLHYYEAFNILFRIENALRVFVYVVLKSKYLSNWADCSIAGGEEGEGNSGTISSVARRRVNQARVFGYLGHSVSCPIMHLTSGELTSLITSKTYWPVFKSYFRASRSIVKAKLNEIGSIRNSLAHFRPIREDDIGLLKQNAGQVLMEVEPCLLELFGCRDIVPSNTVEPWYTALKPLRTDHCVLWFRQSQQGHWVKVELKYRTTATRMASGSPRVIHYYALKLVPSAILRRHGELTKATVFMTHDAPFPRLNDELKMSCEAGLSFHFDRNVLSDHADAIRGGFVRLLNEIEEETARTEGDLSDRGSIVAVADVVARRTREDRKDGWYWSVSSENLKCPVQTDDPPEYWGSFYSHADFIAAASSYPWMQVPVSGSLSLPF